LIYDDAERQLFVRNSWGANWGKKGYFTMPCAYLAD
jgi:C1A family cysteine protease